jgi:hypothetical protein
VRLVVNSCKTRTAAPSESVFRENGCFSLNHESAFMILLFFCGVVKHHFDNAAILSLADCALAPPIGNRWLTSQTR